jgi:hypothetical protein
MSHETDIVERLKEVWLDNHPNDEVEVTEISGPKALYIDVDASDRPAIGKNRRAILRNRQLHEEVAEIDIRAGAGRNVAEDLLDYGLVLSGFQIRDDGTFRVWANRVEVDRDGFHMDYE